MKRRKLLVALGGTMASSAGCLTEMQTPGQQQTPTTKKPVGEYSCPPHESNKSTVCSQTVNTEKATVYTVPSVRKTAKPMEELKLTLHNTSSQAVEFNGGNWSIHAKQDEGWKQVEQTVVADSKNTVEAQSSRTWLLRKIVANINPKYHFESGDYTVSINVPNPTGDNWITCLSLFRVVSKE